MSNKLKDVFSNKIFDIGGNLSFRDEDAHKKFLKALKIVYDEGRTVEVEGVSAISTNVKDGDMIYPLMVERNPCHLVIGPSVETVAITVDTVRGKRTVDFQRHETSTDVIVETGHDEIVFMRFEFKKTGHKVQFTYRMQSQYVKTIKDVVESYCVAIGVMEHLFNPDRSQDNSKDTQSLRAIKQSFQITYSFWEKLGLIEDQLNISFDPAKIESIDNAIQDVEELYLLLVEKKAIHLKAKLTSTEATGITLESDEYTPQVGHALDITFTGESSYTICEQHIVIYTANLLTNAIIKDVLRTETGEIRISYDDTDSTPMYISCTGHKTPEEARTESSLIMKDKERTKRYKEAPTVNEYAQEEANGAAYQQE